MTPSPILFIGLGNMGLPMAVNLMKAGFDICGHDLSDAILKQAENEGLKTAMEIEAVSIADFSIIITMLPAGKHVETVLNQHIFPNAAKDTLLIDCSTIDVATARTLAKDAKAHGILMVDAPVSGGVSGAQAASLTMMVGGTQEGFDRALPILQAMSKKQIHCGDAGAGQGVKICNNLMLGIQMLSVCEGFHLCEQLGLSPEKLFEVASTASGQCWSLTSYCPHPGLVETAPSNKNYQPGFSATMMLKDLNLAMEAAEHSSANALIGQHAQALFNQFVEDGHANTDFSGIVKLYNHHS